MSRRPTSAGNRPPGRAGSGGQAMIELGIIIVLFLTICMGIVEFGRAFMITSMIVNAARDGARRAAVAPLSDASGNPLRSCLSGGCPGNVVNDVQALIDEVADGSSFSIDCPQLCQDGVAVMQVHVTGSIDLVTGFFGATVPVNRTVSFRDEYCTC